MIRQTRKQDGFTLVEVLVSLAIFSLAIVGLNRAATLAVSGTATLQLRTHAGFVADNAVVLTRIEASGFKTDLIQDVSKGMEFDLNRIEAVEVGIERSQAVSGGMEFDVVVETSATEQAGFYEVLVRVTERDRDRVLSERRAFHHTGVASVTTPRKDVSQNETEAEGVRP